MQNRYKNIFPATLVFSIGLMLLGMLLEAPLDILKGLWHIVTMQDLLITDYVSIGDYVVTGGELPAMVMVDAISRLVPGVLHNEASAESESFHDNLLEYPQYSRPEEWHGKRVPQVLLSGHHANIEKWRREQSILRTRERRPDLLKKSGLTEKEKAWLEENWPRTRDGQMEK